MKLVFEVEYETDPDEEITNTVFLMNQELAGWQGVRNSKGFYKDSKKKILVSELDRE